MANHIVTRDSLNDMLADESKRKHVIGRALVVLFNRQTADEKNSNHTRHENGVGFSHADSQNGTLTAKYYLKHRDLKDWMIDKWMKPGSNGFPRICKYWRQLDEAAQEKAARKAA